jgi:hypothetical protein
VALKEITMLETERLVSLAIKDNEGRYLLVPKQNEEDGTRRFDFPRQSVMSTETPAEAAKRLIHDDLQLVTAEPSEFPIYMTSFRPPGGIKDIKLSMYMVQLKPGQRSVAKTPEGAVWDWAPWDGVIVTPSLRQVWSRGVL